MKPGGYIFDLDGTVYLGEHPVPGADAAIRALRARGDRVLFLSNKPIARREEYVSKLRRMGIPVELEEVVNSSLVTARYFQRVCRSGEKVLVVGEEPIREELSKHGVLLTEEPAEARYVLLSWDRGFTYDKLNRVFQAWKRGAEIVASNPDRTCPVAGGELPDTAALIGAVEAVTGQRVGRVVGKPSSLMAQAALCHLGLKPALCWMVGDRLETDIRMARENGLRSALVLTGISTRREAERSPWRPDRILDSIAEVPQLTSR
ncbi:haloacid dehalogenase [Kroppenstedtia guangzhouensis]|uniref:Haloacid dehalogenase n=1 Tax=Kroppenstedtia guangzhouensis TaxID=1274356 RepID=A0ABQ1FWV5_9BACL|nr:HAD-IIA family hydrolase [Kroppenstedtia guangzhouensis]GGA32239.1 haloacid dehalogenase [Kroppenstedtia guangzhouensis]